MTVLAFSATRERKRVAFAMRRQKEGERFHRQRIRIAAPRTVLLVFLAREASVDLAQLTDDGRVLDLVSIGARVGFDVKFRLDDLRESDRTEVVADRLRGGFLSADDVLRPFVVLRQALADAREQRVDVRRGLRCRKHADGSTHHATPNTYHPKASTRPHIVDPHRSSDR